MSVRSGDNQMVVTRENITSNVVAAKEYGCVSPGFLSVEELRCKYNNKLMKNLDNKLWMRKNY